MRLTARSSLVRHAALIALAAAAAIAAFLEGPAVATPTVVLFECRAPDHHYTVTDDGELLRVDFTEDERGGGDAWLWWAQETGHYTFGPDGALTSHATTGSGARGGGVADDGGCSATVATINVPRLRALAESTRALAPPHPLATCLVTPDEGANEIEELTVEPTLRGGVALIRTSRGLVWFAATKLLANDVVAGNGSIARFDDDGVSVGVAVTHLDLGMRGLDMNVGSMNMIGPCRVDQGGVRQLSLLLNGGRPRDPARTRAAPSGRSR